MPPSRAHALSGSGFREYLISPLLTRTAPWPQYARRRIELGIDAPPERTEGFAEAEDVGLESLKTNKLLDTAISGGLAGGVVRGFKCTPVLPFLSSAPFD